MEKSKKSQNMISVRSNELIQRVRYELTPREEDIITYMSTLVDTRIDHFEPVVFYIQDLCRMSNMDEKGGKNYKIWRDAINRLYSRSYWIEGIDEKGNRKYFGFRWLDVAEVTPGSGKVILKFSDSLKPHFLQLKDKFTAHEAYYSMVLRTEHAKRFYLYAKSIHYNKAKVVERYITVEELPERLGAISVSEEGTIVSKYGQWKRMKEKALDPAIKEINEHTDIALSYTVEKSGKKVIGINLSVKSSVRLSDRIYQEIVRGYPPIIEDEDSFPLI